FDLIVPIAHKTRDLQIAAASSACRHVLVLGPHQLLSSSSELSSWLKRSGCFRLFLGRKMSAPSLSSSGVSWTGPASDVAEVAASDTAVPWPQVLAVPVASGWKCAPRTPSATASRMSSRETPAVSGAS